MPRALSARGRGGPRPNSGPPPGNLNALKHGKTSRQQRRLLQLIADNPEARHLLTVIARVQRRRRKQAERDTNRFLIALASRLRERALDEAAARYENDRRIPPHPVTVHPPINTTREKTTIHPT